MMDESFLAGLNGFLEQHEDPNAPQLFAEGDSVGEWRVTGFLGRGGNAEVYRVVHTDGTTGRGGPPGRPQPQQGEAIANELVAALKVIVRSDDASKKRFHQEVALLSSQMGTHFAKWIWNKSPETLRIRSVTGRSFPKCLHCKDRDYCSVCMCRNYNETGDIFTPAQHFCDVAKINHEVVDEAQRRRMEMLQQ